VLDDCALEVTAATRILVDAERGLPIGQEPVAGSEFDFRAARRIGSLRVDHGFCDLDRDANGLAWIRLTGNDGRTTGLWCDETYPFLQVYSGDTLAPERRRLGLAAEPMTSPANALQTGDGIVTLAPQETHQSRWGVRLM
jgi:aldose 1-epimerase